MEGKKKELANVRVEKGDHKQGMADLGHHTPACSPIATSVPEAYE